MEHRTPGSKNPKTKRADDPSSPPPDWTYVPKETDEEEVIDPYAHHRPPFEKLWDANAVPVPAVLQDRPNLEGGVVYFAYGKDMDPEYLRKLFTSSGVAAAFEFVAVGKLSKYLWVIDRSCRFPMTQADGEGEVWGLIYRFSQPCMDVLNSKAKKRGLKMEEHEVETFKRTGEPGFWNAPLLPIANATVHVMVGTLDHGAEEMTIEEEEDNTFEGTKKRKVLAGLLWGAIEGLPEKWKKEVRAKVGGINDARDTQYWTMNTKKPKRLMWEDKGKTDADWKVWCEMSKGTWRPSPTEDDR